MNKKPILFLCLMGLFLASCKKEDMNLQLSSVRVVNAAVNAGAVKVNYWNIPVNWANLTGADITINYGTDKNYTIEHPGNTYNFKIVPSADTSNPVFNGDLNLEQKSVYTLFLAGQTGAYESVFLKENFPAYNDSIIGIRIINLSPNSQPVNITLSGSPTVNEFNAVAYKQVTDFRVFEAKSNRANTFFAFQVRNSSGTLLATYTLTAANLVSLRQRNATLVFRGLIGATGANAPGLSFVGHF